MMNLAMSEIMAGANFWDAPWHSMAGSNDLPTRKKIFDWIKDHESTFYLPRTPIDPIGIYFSPETRNFYPKDFIASYRGILILLMQEHREFQIVTPRTLEDFRGETLVLPDVRVLSEEEKRHLQSLARQGNRLVITGIDVTESGDSKNVVRFPECPGRTYSAALEKDFEHTSPQSQQGFLDSLKGGDAVHVVLSPQVATSFARTSDGHINCFFANFAGLVGGINPVQVSQRGVKVTVKSASASNGFFLPFLGVTQPIKGIREGNATTFTLPEIPKGAVFWYEP